VHLKSTRAPTTISITLQEQDPNTSILDLKTVVAERLGVGREGVRLLWRKRPVGDSKVLRELIAGDEAAQGEGAGELELGVMILGGGAGAGAVAGAGAAVGAEKAGSEDKGGKGQVEEGMSTEGVEGEGRGSGMEVLNGEEFWGDLKGFLTQRLRDEEVGEEVFSVFRGAWQKR